MTGEAVRVKLDMRVRPGDFSNFWSEQGILRDKYAFGGRSTMVSMVPVDENGRRTTCAWPRYLQD